MPDYVWYQFRLKSGNHVVVKATTRAKAKARFLQSWPDQEIKIYDFGDDLGMMPEDYVELLIGE